MQISRKQISGPFQAKSMSLPEVFPASRSALPENEKARTMKDTSGRKCSGQSKKSSRNGSWQKTFSALLLGMEGWYSKKCGLTWKTSVTRSNRMYFRLQASGRRTDGSASGSSPAKAPKKVGFYQGNLYPRTSAGQKILQGLLPTPLASDATMGGVIGAKDQFWITKTGMPRKMNRNGKSGSVGLARLVRLIHSGVMQRTREDGIITGSCVMATLGADSQLNPLFVTQMMGYPTRWMLEPYLKESLTRRNL